MDKFLKFVLALTLSLCLAWGVIVMAGPTIVANVLSNQFGERATFNGVTVTPRLTLRINNLQVRDANDQRDPLIARAVEFGWSLERGNLLILAKAGYVTTDNFVARQLEYSGRIFLNSRSPAKLSIDNLSIGPNTLRDVSLISGLDLVDLTAYDLKIGLTAFIKLEDFAVEALATLAATAPVKLKNPIMEISSHPINFDILDLAVSRASAVNSPKIEFVSSDAVDQSISGSFQLGSDDNKVQANVFLENIKITQDGMSFDIGNAEGSVNFNPVSSVIEATLKPSRATVSVKDLGVIDFAQTPIEFQVTAKGGNIFVPPLDYKLTFWSQPPLHLSARESECVDAQCRVHDIVARAGDFELALILHCDHLDCSSRSVTFVGADADVFGFGRALAQTGLVDPLTIMQAFARLK